MAKILDKINTFYSVRRWRKINQEKRIWSYESSNFEQVGQGEDLVEQWIIVQNVKATSKVRL